MGTTVECLLDGDPRDGFARVEAEFERLEALLSRFRPESELSRLNREGSLEAGPDLLRVTSLALEARERSGGLFDPTVLDAVVAAGYDRSFELVPADGPSAADGARCGGGIRIEGDRIELEPGTHLDLGGIAKGYAVDRAVELLAAYGPCLVNAGGDLAVRGGAWPVGVDGSVTLELDLRRDRHVRPRPAALEPRRRGAAPPDRPRHRPPRGRWAASRDRRRAERGRGRGAGEDRLPRRRGGRPARAGDRGRPHDARGRPRMTHDPTFWLLARSAGFTAYVLLTLSVLAGLVLKSRPFRALKPAVVTDTHRTLAMLGLGALALHGTALVLDQTVRMPVWALVVPFTSAYRPVATTIGVLTAELMVLIYASFSMRKRIGPKNWRRLHWATYAVFGAQPCTG